MVKPDKILDASIIDQVVHFLATDVEKIAVKSLNYFVTHKSWKLYISKGCCI